MTDEPESAAPDGGAARIGAEPVPAAAEPVRANEPGPASVETSALPVETQAASDSPRADEETAPESVKEIHEIHPAGIHEETMHQVEIGEVPGRARGEGEPGPGGHAPIVTGNTRLTRSLGAVLFWLVLVQFFSAVLFFGVCVNWPLPLWLSYSFTRAVHFFVGFMLVPLVLFKLATTSWKAAGYYLGRKLYRREGPPRWYNRALSPAMGVTFLVVMWSGVAMWGSYEYLFPIPYLYHDYRVVQWHLWSSVFLAGLVLFHIVAHFAETFRSRARKKLEDAASPEPAPLTLGRRTAVWGFVAAGAGLAVSAAQWPWPRLSWLSKYHDGPGPLDYPVVTYFGSGTRVDALKWRLKVTGAVERALELTYEDILRLPSVEVSLPLQCVQGWRIERVWRGVPLRSLYELAGARVGFKSVYVHSVSGYHFTNHAKQHLQRDALLVTHVGGVALSDEHGFPVRILLPGLPGQNCPKWVDRLEVRMEDAPRYYSPNFYSEYGPTGPLTEPTREYVKSDGRS